MKRTDAPLISKKLLVIDNSKLRQESFFKAEKVLKKIDRLEMNIESFQSQDQRLFDNWYELTFREQREQVAQKQEELERLFRFDYWIMAAAEMMKIIPAEAYELLKKEEVAYAQGSTEERQRIDQLRKEREDYLRSEMEKEFRAKNFDEDACDETWDDEESSADKEAFEHIRKMTDDEIRETCRTKAGTFELLEMAFDLAEELEQIRVLVHIWDLAPEKHREAFVKFFMKNTDMSFDLIIEDMREALLEEDEATAKGDQQSFSGQFENPGASQKAETQPEEAELLKIIYRKLVRKLHPDLQQERQGDKLTGWQERIWHRVQMAYQRKDMASLEKLYKITLLRAKELHDLSVSELQESHLWLEAELVHLQEDSKSFKRLPSWGFSRKKKFDSLQTKLQKNFDQTLDAIEYDIRYLRARHKHLEDILKMLKRLPPERKGAQKKQNSRRTTHR